MAHRLAIGVQSSISDLTYSPWLKDWEFPRGSDADCIWYIQNIGNLEFAGVLKNITVLFDAASFGSATSIVKQDLQLRIDRLHVGETRRMYQSIFRMLLEGPGWFKCSLQADDGQHIEYYQGLGGPLLQTNEWMWGFNVINREQLQIIRLLDDLLKRTQPGR